MKLAYCGEENTSTRVKNKTLNIFKRGDILQMPTNTVLKTKVVRQIKLFSFSVI